MLARLSGLGQGTAQLLGSLLSCWEPQPMEGWSHPTGGAGCRDTPSCTVIVTQPFFPSSLYGGTESNTAEKISWLYTIPLKAAGWPSSLPCDLLTHTGAILSPRSAPGKGCTPRCGSPRAAAGLTGAQSPPQNLPRPRQTLQGGICFLNP